MNTTYQENRHFTRIPFDADVTITNAQSGTRYQARLIDISLKGALTSQPPDWPQEYDNAYQLTLNLAEKSEQTRLSMEVNVAHSENKHIGFHISHMDLDTATHLHRLVELNLGDERLLQRELEELSSGTG